MLVYRKMDLIPQVTLAHNILSFLGINVNSLKTVKSKRKSEKCQNQSSFHVDKLGLY